MIMDKSGVQAKIGDTVYFINSIWDSKPYLQKGIITQVRVGCADVEWELNSLQYNPKVEQVKRYQMKIDQMIDTIEAETSVTAIKNAREIISGLRKEILELENEVADYARKHGKVKGGMQLSWLENLKENRALYNKIIEKKK